MKTMHSLWKRLLILPMAAAMLFVFGQVAALDAHAADTAGKVTVDGTTQEFSTMAKLVDYIVDKNGKTIVINMNADWTEDVRLYIPTNANVTLYMNGHIFDRGLANVEKGWKSDGDCVYMCDGSTLTINGGDASTEHTTYVYENNSPGNSISSTAKFSGGVIAGGNSSSGGGGITIQKNCKLTLNNVTIAGCRAEETWWSGGYGGGIRANSDNINITMNDSVISGCYAQNKGGAIYQNNKVGFSAVHDITITMNDSRIEKCHVGKDGATAGIYLEGEQNATIKGNGNSIITELGEKGQYYTTTHYEGHALSCAGAETKISGLIIEKNGSGIYTLGNNAEISDCIIRNNMSRSSTLGISLGGENSWIHDCEIINNQAYTYHHSTCYPEYKAIGLDVVYSNSKITGKMIVKNNTWDYQGFAKTDSNFVVACCHNIDLEEGSDMHVAFAEDTHVGESHYIGENSPNCIRYMTADNNRYYDKTKYKIVYKAADRQIWLVPETDTEHGETADYFQHDVTVSYDGKDAATTSYQEAPDGDTVTATAKESGDGIFAGWEAKVGDTDVTDVILVDSDGNSTKTNKAVSFELPATGTKSTIGESEFTWAEGYAVTLNAVYTAKISHVQINKLTAPKAGDDLDELANAFFYDDSNAYADDLSVAWSYMSDGKEISASGKALNGTAYTAAINIPKVANEREFVDDAENISVQEYENGEITSFPDTYTITKSKNAADGSLTVKITFPATESGETTPAEPVLLKIMAYDMNNDSTVKTVEIYVEKGKQVAMTAPDIDNMIFNHWTTDDENVKISGNTAASKTAKITISENAAGPVSIKAAYIPVVTQVTVTVAEPEAGKKLTSSAAMTIKITNEFEVAADDIGAVVWSPADTSAKSGVEYTATVKLKPHQNDDGNEYISVRNITAGDTEYKEYPVSAVIFADDLSVKFNDVSTDTYDTGAKSVTGRFAALDKQLASIEDPAVVFVASEDDVTTDKLPATVTIKLTDGTEMKATVTWGDLKEDTLISGKYDAEGTVTLPDGVNNDDEIALTVTGTIVYADGHTHSLNKVEAVAATCTSKGNNEYYKCSTCGLLFKDENATEEIDLSDTVTAALGHEWGEWVETTPATETTDGVETRTCSRCGETQTRSIPYGHEHRLSHVDAVEATCTKGGHKEYWVCDGCGKCFSDENGTTEVDEADVATDALGHDWDTIYYGFVQNDAGKYTAHHAYRECKRCGEKEEERVGVTSTVKTPATCAEKGWTTYTAGTYKNSVFKQFSGDTVDVNDIPIDSEAHDWDEGTVTTDPTCTEKGVKTYTCKNDPSHTKTEDVDALGHNWGEWKVTTEATNASEGEKTRTCSRCGEVETQTIAKLNTKKTVLVAKGIAKGKRKAVISWNNVKADRYVVYIAKCNYNTKKYKFKKVKTLSGKKLKYTTKSLKKNRCYKFKVVAQKKVNGKYKKIATSYEGHFCTANVRGSLTNPKSMTINKTEVTLTKGSSIKLSAKVAKVKNNKKLATTHAKLLRFKSDNPTVATVNANGKVTAKSPGTATIYVVTINGIWKTCKVTVK